MNKFTGFQKFMILVFIIFAVAVLYAGYWWKNDYISDSKERQKQMEEFFDRK